MSPALRSMNRALGMVISSFEAMQTSASDPLNTSSIAAARQELARADAAFNTLENDIRESRQEQDRFNGSLRQGSDSARNMASAVKGLIVAVGGGAAIKNIAEQADQYAGVQARLGLINDGQQTVAELNDKIMASADRARAVYSDTANVVSKLGITASHSFKNNDEMIRFAELMNKNFKISGASLQEQTSAMYQLTQAMAAGKLQGDEFRSILENAPLLAQAIAKQMGKPIGELKEMSSQGAITSDIIKAALFNSADQIEERFSQMPMTFGDMATRIKNTVSAELEPLFADITQWLNSDTGAESVRSVALGFAYLATVMAGVLMAGMELYGFFATNWPMIGPFVYGAVGAFLAFNAVILAHNAILGVKAGLMVMDAARTAWATGATLAQVAATTTATGAQVGLNAALLASPLTWFALIIIGIVAAMYAAIGAVNKFAGTSISATGIITSVFFTMGAFIANVLMGILQIGFAIVEGLVNQFAMGANFIGNIFNDPVGSVIHLFGDMADGILNGLERVAKGIDTIFGTSLASKVAGMRAGLSNLTNTLASSLGNGTYDVKMGKFNAQDALASLGISFDRFSMIDASAAGYKWGKGLKMPSLGANSDKALGLDLTDTNALLGGIGEDTKGIKDSVSITEEDLRYMRDLAEQEVINRYTTAEIKVEQTNTFGDIRETADLDGVVAALGTQIRDTIAVVAEGEEPDV